MTKRTRRRWPVAVLGAALTTGGVTAVAVPAGASSRTHVVHRGESIQAALDAADPGDRVVVRPGDYAEQLTIETDGIELVGHGARLTPPDHATANVCSGIAGPDTEAGICVTGRDVVLADFVVEHREVLSVGHYVADVSISGFEVGGFSGPDVALVGASNARISRNLLVDGARYGALTNGSKGTRIVANTVLGTSPRPFIGICMDDVTPPLVSGNRVAGYEVGLCVQTQGAEIRDNHVHNMCIGAYIDPGIGARFHDNRIGATNPLCLAQNAYGVYGIILDGAVGSTVSRNHIAHQLADGIAIVDATGPFASSNVVTRNVITANDPELVDLRVDTQGTGNVVTDNRCSKSVPDGLCD